MTRQRADILLFDGRIIDLDVLPLDAYTEPRGLDTATLLPEASTALWRRYQGVWEIHQAGLYLVGLLGEAAQALDLSVLFPGRTLPVFADWFSGRLYWNEGETLFTHWNARIDETTHRRFLYFQHGRLLRQRRVNHQPAFIRRHALAAEHYRAREAARRAGVSVGPEVAWCYTLAGFRLLGIEPGDDEFVDAADPWTPEDAREWFNDISGALSRPQ